MVGTKWQQLTSSEMVGMIAVQAAGPVQITEWFDLQKSLAFTNWF